MLFNKEIIDMTEERRERLGKELDRRGFIQLCAATGSGLVFYGGQSAFGSAPVRGLVLGPEAFLGKLREDGHQAPVPEAIWYRSEGEGDGLLYRFEPGALASSRYLTADMLLDGAFMTSFQLVLQEGETGPAFTLGFALLNQCSARIRMLMSAVDQNRWRFEREGAWLKPRAGGDRVNLDKVDRMMVKVTRSGGRPSRWCLTHFTATAEEVPTLSELILPQGALLDELGQSRLHEWAGKSKNRAEVTTRLKEQLSSAPGQTFPAVFTKYGGWKDKRFKATGFFRTEYDGRRWWLVDPEGYAYWSAGMDCVRVDTEANYEGLEKTLTWKPEPTDRYKGVYSAREAARPKSINYLAANLIEAFGETWYDSWKKIALAELRRLGFNTVANWSDWQIAREAGFPYVRPLSGGLRKAPTIYRDFPDVFAPEFEEDARQFGQQLADTRDDPAFLGYFLMNEPTWGFSKELPAVGMLYNTPSCATRNELARFLKQRYSDNQALAAAWQVATSFDEVARGAWKHPVRGKAPADLEEFSGIMTDRFFKTLSQACRDVDPNHLNLGIRYQSVPPRWVVEGMRTFDVFSMNCYREKVPYQDSETISRMLKMPVMIGEWHFGALDAGLPASGIGHVKDQRARAQAYRVYLEDAAANPYCVGVHWFTLYDQSALGRFDGENYNIGFLDICNRPYEEIGQAARISHERFYEVAAGTVEKYRDAPVYLPKLYT
jgi:hypothetical protein